MAKIKPLRRGKNRKKKAQATVVARSELGEQQKRRLAGQQARDSLKGSTRWSQT
jgi:hypothetical protein